MKGIGLTPPADKRFDVVGLGLNSADHLCTVSQFPRFDSKDSLVAYHCLPGGQVATALVALQRWGVSTAYVGSFGDDYLGQVSRDSLAAEGVNLDASSIRKDTSNQIAVILVDQTSGERTVLMHRPEALVVKAKELSREVVCSARILHLDGYDHEAAVTAARWAREDGIPTVIDLDISPGPAQDILPLIDVLIVSYEFARELSSLEDSEEQLAWLLEASRSRLVAVTLGAKGFVARCGERRFSLPGHRVKCVDTTGAGDIFHAGVIYAMLMGWEVELALRFANAAAALKCTGIGGRSAIPRVEDALSLGRSGVYC